MSTYKVCLDAGHGGKDPGACNGNYHEADAALSIVLKLGEILEDKGIEVFYTRKNDMSLRLNDRTWVANRNNVDCFVSIHLNSAENKDANGIETLRYPVDEILDKTLAAKVQNNLVNITGAKDRGVKNRSDLYVLKHTKMTAILVETGFISNDDECKLLFTESYQYTLANTIANSIENWFKETM